ncbi:PIG-L family deacetylase [Microbispora amethystogenes]|uniref:PIG-L deacetylase family protein n=1 Tax=Microbispora amethystogenes TaxID=1427754 RepID=UPI0033C1C47B
MATVLAFHAHPDDEALLTGGTLAKLTAEGHRVIVVVVSEGVMGEATGPEGRVPAGRTTRRRDVLRTAGQEPA